MRGFAIVILSVGGLCACEKKTQPVESTAEVGERRISSAVAPAEAVPMPVASAAPKTVDPLSDGNAPLYHPTRASEQAPEKFRVKFETSKGEFVVEVVRDWAPQGADRFFNLVKLGYYDGNRFYRAVNKFMVQWGVHGDPRVNGAWYRANITDDPVKKSNMKGYLSFAAAGPDSRTTQIFINTTDANRRLDKSGFAPFGRIVAGYPTVEKIYTGYGDFPPNGSGPEGNRVQREGNVYLEQEFPKLDHVIHATIE